MRYKIFSPNPNGKIEFTKEELEALLTEVFHEGRDSKFVINYGYPWYQYTTLTGTALDSITTTTTDTLKINY